MDIQDMEEIRLVSRRGSMTAKVKIADVVAKGMAFVPFHFAEAAANNLTIAALDALAKIPKCKVCPVRVEKAAGRESSGLVFFNDAVALHSNLFS
jgi:predicted molibdopterin-dependent oxidoreductase YjgC